LRNPLLLTLGLGVFAGALDSGVLSPALPALAQTFGVATGDLAWIFNVYLLVTVVAISIAGVMADRHGRRPVYIACVALFALGSILAIAAPSYGFFLLARALQALGAGGIFPVATAAIGDVVPADKRGAALGLVAATWGLAAIVGPAFGGLVTHFISWRWIFAANLPLAAIVIWLARKYVPTIAPHVRPPADVVGVALLSIGLLALTGGIIGTHLITIAAGVLLLAGFVLWERTAAHPLIPPAMLASKQLVLTYLLEVAIGALEGSLFFIPTVLIASQGMSYAVAGGIAALGALTFVIVIPISGRALDEIGSRDVLLIGALFTEIGLSIFALGFSSIWLTVLAMIVAGVGFGALLGAPTRYIVTNESTAETRGTAIGLLSQGLIVGMILGTALAGGIMNSANVQSDGFRETYLTFAAIAILALFITMFLKPQRAERASTAKSASTSLV
jgi:MFS family permease